MSATIYAIPDLIARRAQGERVVHDTFGVYGREYKLDIKFTGGEILDRPVFRPGGPKLIEMLGPGAGLQQRAAGEMLTTPPFLDAFVQKTVIDLAVGRETVPILYTPIYRRMVDANFTELVNIGNIVSRANVVFLDHIEAEEVVFGAREWAIGQAVQLYTYTAGFEWTEDMVEWDKTWEATQASEAFGRAYNALLNHLHLYPILSYNYPAKNITDGTTDDLLNNVPWPAPGTPDAPSLRLKIHTTIRAAQRAAAQDDNTDTGLPRSPTVMLAPTSARYILEDAMDDFSEDDEDFGPISGLGTIIYYDGYSTRVGRKPYHYPGVPDNTLFLVDPNQYLIELVKHDLRVDAFPGDMSRLIAQQVIARTRRGVFCAPEECVQKVILPA